MNSTIYLILIYLLIGAMILSKNPASMIFILIFIGLYLLSRSSKAAIIRKTIERRKKGDTQQMKELAKKFIDKECLILAFDSAHQYEGVIKEVTDGAVLIDNNGSTEAINLDFVIRIKEHPKKKNGKKKTVVTVDDEML